MTNLKERLGQGETRKKLVVDACEVLDQEVADKGGLSGMAIKGAYSIVKGIKPGFIGDAVDALVDDFLEALDPLYQEAEQKGLAPGQYLSDNADRMAEKLLAITDQRVARSSHTVIRKTYDKLRPSAKKHVSAAAQRLGQLLTRHFAT